MKYFYTFQIKGFSSLRILPSNETEYRCLLTITLLIAIYIYIYIYIHVLLKRMAHSLFIIFFLVFSYFLISFIFLWSFCKISIIVLKEGATFRFTRTIFRLKNLVASSGAYPPATTIESSSF